MGKHARSKTSTAKRTTAKFSILALAVAPVAMLPGSSFGAGACESLDNPANGIHADALEDNICQVLFTQNATNWALPAGVEKLSAVAIGGGGGALKADNDPDPEVTNFVGFGGAGGQFNAVDTVPLANPTFDVTIGAAGSSASTGTSAGAGLNSTLSVSGGAVVITAVGGLGGSSPHEDDSNSSVPFSLTGTLDNGGFDNYLNTDGSVPGAGTGGHSSGTAQHGGGTGAGGAGISIDFLVGGDGDFGGGYQDYLDPVLWAEDIELLESGLDLLSFDFGSGGGIVTTPKTEIAGSGRGAEANPTGSPLGDAGKGILVMRFVIPAPTVAEPEPEATPTTQPAPIPYSGPVPIMLSGTCLPAAGGTLTLTGERLTEISGATVSGKDATVSGVTATSLKLTFPALAAGTYDVTYLSSSGSITHQDSLRVCATSGSSTPAVTTPTGSGAEAGTADPNQRLYVYKRFTNYRGDRGGVVDADRRAITAFIRANPGLTHVTCVGSTSGVPALETDPALATARANGACDVVKSLLPGVSTRIAINTGLGAGQFFRAVVLHGTGTKSN